jgi:hypothetical protein
MTVGAKVRAVSAFPLKQVKPVLMQAADRELGRRLNPANAPGARQREGVFNRDRSLLLRAGKRRLLQVVERDRALIGTAAPLYSR